MGPAVVGLKQYTIDKWQERFDRIDDCDTKRRHVGGDLLPPRGARDDVEAAERSRGHDPEAGEEFGLGRIVRRGVGVKDLCECHRVGGVQTDDAKPKGLTRRCDARCPG